MRKLGFALAILAIVAGSAVTYAATITTSVINFNATFTNGVTVSVTGSAPLGAADFTAIAQYLDKQAVALTPTPAK